MLRTPLLVNALELPLEVSALELPLVVSALELPLVVSALELPLEVSALELPLVVSLSNHEGGGTPGTPRAVVRGRRTHVPALPPWNALHPLVVHFPIALLLVVPLIICVGLAGRPGRGVLGVAFLLLLLGTAGAWLAAATGESAGQLADRQPGVDAILERHEDLAETTRTLFTALTLVYGGLLALPRMLKRELSRGPRLALHGGFVVLHLAALGPLVATAHQGGRLVHEKGVHALLPPEPPVDAPRTAASHRDEG